MGVARGRRCERLSSCRGPVGAADIFVPRARGQAKVGDFSHPHLASRCDMKTSYQFANLLGSVYTAGNVVFTPDGETVLSPVGNRLSIFHLGRNTSTTLPFETRKPIARVALSPTDPDLVLVADVDGRSLLADIRRRSVIASIHFKRPLRAAKFSNDGKYIAISHGPQVQVWKVPSTIGRQFNPFELHRTYTGHFDDVLSIEWSRDSK